MTLIEKIYQSLTSKALVESAEEFSTDWCKRSKSWFAVQKRSKAEFTIPVAINCLNKVKTRLTFKLSQKNKVGSFVDDEIAVLHAVRDQLEAYLLEKHRICRVAGDLGPHTKATR